MMTDALLVAETLELVKNERLLLIDVLKHLREIDRRRLYSDYKFKSMHEMCVKYFKYSDDQAYRRVAAARLLSEIPKVEEKINSGELNLTTMNIAHSLFKQEKAAGTPLKHDQKIEVLEELAGKSSREAERITLALSSQPEMLKPDRINYVSPQRVEIKFTASHELPEKIQTLKGLLAHKSPGITLGDLFEQLIDDALKTAAPRKPSLIARVLAKQSNCCICKSTYALEIDHIKPRALGGTDELENLRVLCRSCNQRAAIKQFGPEKMQTYFS